LNNKVKHSCVMSLVILICCGFGLLCTFCVIYWL